MFETLKTMPKTATVASVKLTTPADRIGLGLGVATYPTDNLSPGQFPVPHNPAPEQVRSREALSAMQPRMRMHEDGDAVPPAGSAGCTPGFSAVRSGSIGALTLSGWRRATRTTVGGSTREVRLTTDPGRADFRDDLRHDDRSGRDCQSLRRTSGKRGRARAEGTGRVTQPEVVTRRVGSAATAAK
jgi:hypothetical protein